MWKPVPFLPECEPLWPGCKERLLYKGLLLRPDTDIEAWDIIDDVWEISLGRSDDLLMTVHADREQAIAIATALADGKDWTRVHTRNGVDLASEPLVLRLMAEHPGIIELPSSEPEPDWDDDVPYGEVH